MRPGCVPIAFSQCMRETSCVEMNEMNNSCKNCGAELDGYVIAGEILEADDIVAFFSGRVTRETVNDWFVKGLLHGFKMPGVRGWVITMGQFRSDLDALMKRDNRRERLMPRAPRLVAESSRT